MTVIPFIQKYEDVPAGILPHHRKRNFQQIARLFKYHHMNFHNFQKKYEKLIMETRKHDDDFWRELAIAWGEQHARFYQPKQRLLLGLMLSAVKTLGVEYVSVDYSGSKMMFYFYDLNNNGFKYHNKSFRFKNICEEKFPINSLNCRETWFNYRHAGIYDLRDKDIFKNVTLKFEGIPLVP